MINNTFSGSLRRLKTWWALRRSRRESSREGNKCSWRAPGWELSDFSSKTAFASLRTPFVAHGGSLYTLWQMWRESSRWGQRNPESGWKWGSPCWRLKNASRVNTWKIHFNWDPFRLSLALIMGDHWLAHTKPRGRPLLWTSLLYTTGRGGSIKAKKLRAY